MTLFTSNSTIDIKRQALASLDVDVLRKIQAHEADNRNRVYLYSRLSEHCIRNKNGMIINAEILPLPQSKIIDHYWTIDFAKRIHDLRMQPGSLFNEIIDRPDYLAASVVILEVPDHTEFPLPDSFDWITTCMHWLADNKPWYRHRLNGVVFDKMFFAMEGKPNNQLTWLSVESLTDDQLLKILDNHNH